MRPLWVEIVPDLARPKERILRDDAEPLTDRVEADGGEVDTVDRDGP